MKGEGCLSIESFRAHRTAGGAPITMVCLDFYGQVAFTRSRASLKMLTFSLRHYTFWDPESHLTCRRGLV